MSISALRSRVAPDVPPAFTLDELRQLNLRAEFYAAAAQLVPDADPVWYAAYQGLVTSTEILLAVFVEAGRRETRIMDWLAGRKNLPGKT